MDEEVLEKLKKAGEAVAAAREYAKDNVEEGASWLEVADGVEEKIKEMGAESSFPCNVSANEVAAHDLPEHDDDRVFEPGDVIKLDIGAHVDGWIADSAVTVIVGDNEEGEELKEAAQEALDAAVPLVEPDGKLADVSEKIDETIRDAGFQPVVNLTGHRLERYDVHASPSIPNIENDSSYEFEEGDVFAIEPFTTSGVGMVKESGGASIFEWAAGKHTRFPESREILRLAEEEYSKLPFAQRWLVRDMDISPGKLKLVLKQLLDQGSLYEYPPLKEESGSLVAQAEHTVVVGEEGPLVITE